MIFFSTVIVYFYQAVPNLSLLLIGLLSVEH